VILLTVGTQLPFDRLVEIVDRAAPTLSEEVFAQIGESALEPANLSWHRNVDPNEFERQFIAARLIVGHAGVGTVLMALRHNKPLLVMPRRAALREHRNDHQLATCRALTDRPGVYVAYDEATLTDLLHRDLAPPGADDHGGRREQFAARVVDAIRRM
jgi:UDP-N-acetylglucosamine transferase subunit ALG13